jgi:hypothetical protein
MAFTEIELRKIDMAVGGLCRRRTRPDLKHKLSIEYRIRGHDVLIFERRPKWNGTPGFTESGVAKLKFTRRTRKWRLLWQRADLKWHAYQPQSRSNALVNLVAEVDADPWGCFFG